MVMEVEVLEVAIMICDGFIYSFICNIYDEEVVQGSTGYRVQGTDSSKAQRNFNIVK